MKTFMIGYLIGAAVAVIGTSISSAKVIRNIRAENRKLDFQHLLDGLEIANLKMEVQLLQQRQAKTDNKSEDKSVV